MIGAGCGKLVIFAETPIDPIELDTELLELHLILL
jgi:hypothetical protein